MSTVTPCTAANTPQDFGISAFVDSTLAVCHTFLGTVTYMSPERVNNQPYSSPADIWSLGLTLLEMATGRCVVCLDVIIAAMTTHLYGSRGPCCGIARSSRADILSLGLTRLEMATGRCAAQLLFVGPCCLAGRQRPAVQQSRGHLDPVAHAAGSGDRQVRKCFACALPLVVCSRFTPTASALIHAAPSPNDDR